jgi:hypothetical protein
MTGVLRTDGDSVTKGGTQKLLKYFKIVESYWHDHSLESSWKALSDGNISCSIQFSGNKCNFCIFLKKSQSLKS